mmetsp:Transcript_110948/g.357922  ORF Transcript_110948/g.357922 Transcript_110948/m.357922 type:complete len:209 (+) Transcript_110948:742-1368(+)
MPHTTGQRAVIIKRVPEKRTAALSPSPGRGHLRRHQTPTTQFEAEKAITSSMKAALVLSSLSLSVGAAVDFDPRLLPESCLESVGLGVDMLLVISEVLRIFNHILPWHEQQSLSSCDLRCCLQSAQHRGWKCSIAGVPAVLVVQPIANGRGWADPSSANRPARGRGKGRAGGEPENPAARTHTQTQTQTQTSDPSALACVAAAAPSSS